jgi:hypothetical protein
VGEWRQGSPRNKGCTKRDIHQNACGLGAHAHQTSPEHGAAAAGRRGLLLVRGWRRGGGGGRCCPYPPRTRSHDSSLPSQPLYSRRCRRICRRCCSVMRRGINRQPCVILLELMQLVLVRGLGCCLLLLLLLLLVLQGSSSATSECREHHQRNVGRDRTGDRGPVGWLRCICAALPARCTAAISLRHGCRLALAGAPLVVSRSLEILMRQGGAARGGGAVSSHLVGLRSRGCGRGRAAARGGCLLP